MQSLFWLKDDTINTNTIDLDNKRRYTWFVYTRLSADILSITLTKMENRLVARDAKTAQQRKTWCCVKYADNVRRKWSAYYTRWVRSRVGLLHIHRSLSHYQWLKKNRGEFIIQEPVIHLPLLLSLSVSLSLSLSPCIGRTCGGKNPHGFAGFEPSRLPGKLPRACWAFNEVHNDLCCLMYRK